MIPVLIPPPPDLSKCGPGFVALYAVAMGATMCGIAYAFWSWGDILGAAVLAVLGAVLLVLGVVLAVVLVRSARARRLVGEKG